MVEAEISCTYVDKSGRCWMSFVWAVLLKGQVPVFGVRCSGIFRSGFQGCGAFLLVGVDLSFLVMDFF